VWETIVLFLEQNAVAAGSAGGIAGVGVVIWAVVKAPFSRLNARHALSFCAK
jgi:hypothetical protein